MATKKKQPAKVSSKKTTIEKKKASAVKKSTPRITKEQPAVKQNTTQFPIVGIGASAGGLEAFEAFFSAMPENSGMAFVLIAHLDPSHSSILPELIQKKTKMKVTQATDNLKVQPNQVYTIAPNKEMAILNGTLQLLEMSHPRGHNLPIDFFFRSLAQDQGSNAIGIVLSGTGTDGTLGLRAIKGEAGMVMVQDEDSAKYDGMPRNAIATGIVDFILPPDKMPEKLLGYVNHAMQNPADRISGEDESMLNALQKIFVLLRTSTKHDFSLYKKNTICRRIERRMHVHQIDKVTDYLRYLQESNRETKILFKELLIGVTSFFRDPKGFELLKSTYLPALFVKKPEDYQIRIWVPGCSSGEEVYSIAIVVQESMADMNRHFNVQIFGTDIDDEAVNAARLGLYPEAISSDVSPERLKNFFTRQGNYYQIKKTIREMVVFAPQNIIKDPPFTKLDMLCCRNLLIYFGQELQKKLMPIFHYSLKQDGLLFLGSSESIGQHTDLFTVLDKKGKIFKRLSAEMATRTVLDFPTHAFEVQIPVKKTPEPLKPVDGVNMLKLVKTILSQSEIPACVVIDDQTNIIYVHGRTGRFLEPAEGETSINVLEMARPGLKAGLTSAIRKLTTDRQETVVKGLQVKDNGGYVDVNLIVRPLPDLQTGHRGMMMVIFEDVSLLKDKTPHKPVPPKRQKKSDDAARLEYELQYTRENLQTTIEELETSNEELKSTNEELQSTNEELQSTNEEMETSKEELQSLNEESATVNAELQCRIDELNKANDDIKNLLDATEIATIFLDINLGVRRFTARTAEIFPLTATDIGRPIRHFASNLKSVDLHHNAKQVLENLAMQEMEAETIEGRWFRVRIRPYRTINNKIDGVVITFEDISKIKKFESEISKLSLGFEEKLLMMSKVFMDGADPIIIEDLDGRIIEVNDETIDSYGWARKELIGKDVNILTPPERHAETAELLKTCKKNRKAVRNIEGIRLHKTGKIIPALLTYCLLTNLKGEVCAIATIAKNYPPPSNNMRQGHEK
jgi:two-component system CheB/CheR fusion protein